jgi:hypothetical protein
VSKERIVEILASIRVGREQQGRNFISRVPLRGMECLINSLV